MWEEFVGDLRGTRLAAWFRTDPLKAMVAACLACLAGAVALGQWAPWPFLQNAAADFVGGIAAGLVLFVVANIALGFTERRARERHALKIAYDLLWLDLGDTLNELARVVRVLRAGTLRRDDPVLYRPSIFEVENWQLLIQSPLIADLSPDFVWKIQYSYQVSRRAHEALRQSAPRAFGRGPEACQDLCAEHLPKFEIALKRMASALEELQPVHIQAGSGKTRRD